MSVDATRFVWSLSKEIISPLEKLILLAIADRCGERGECWPSIARLMADTNLAKDAIVRHRTKLISQGILKYTGEMKGKSKQIPVMQLVMTQWREGSYVEDEIDHALPATGSQLIPVPVANKDRYHALPATRNLKEEPKKEPNNYCASKSTLNGFNNFWDLYPSKKAKKKCLEIWKRRKLDAIADEIINKLKNQIENEEQWKNGFIPNPTTYLNQDRWNDEITISKTSIREKELATKKSQNDEREAAQLKRSQELADYETNKHKQYNQDGKAFREITTKVAKEIPEGFKNLKNVLGIKS